MSDAVKRFKKIQALSKSAKPWKSRDISTSIEPTDMSADAVLSSARLHMDEGFVAESLDADTILAEIHGHINAAKIDALIDSCQRECSQAVNSSLQAVSRSFGTKKDKCANKDKHSPTSKKPKEEDALTVEDIPTIAKEEGKIALLQAIDFIMEEFVQASFTEVRDAWKNGFKGTVDDGFLDALKTRLMRVVKRVQSKWKEAGYVFGDNFISGFLPKLVSMLINMFTTTASRIGRFLYEGVMFLYQAMKVLAFPEEGVTLAEAADEALKTFSTGLVTTGGIVFAETLEKALLPFLGTLTPYVSTPMIGLATGLTSASIVYLLDHLDVFGVQAAIQHKQVMERLTGAIKISHERALEAAAIFDGPVLHHLT